MPTALEGIEATARRFPYVAGGERAHVVARAPWRAYAVSRADSPRKRPGIGVSIRHVMLMGRLPRWLT
jgi:hypothetical protein